MGHGRVTMTVPLRGAWTRSVTKASRPRGPPPTAFIGRAWAWRARPTGPAGAGGRLVGGGSERQQCHILAHSLDQEEG